MELKQALKRIREVEERNRRLEVDNLILESQAFSYRILLEHQLALAVAAGAEVAEIAAALNRKPARVGGHLRRVT